MEDPKPHWEYMGSAEGSTLEEVCNNYAKVDPVFAADYCVVEFPYAERGKRIPSFWGWDLKIISESQKMTESGEIIDIFTKDKEDDS